MADALISVVVNQLASYVQHEVNLVVSVREEVRKLTTTLKLLQTLLVDAEHKQVNHSAVKVWLEELRDVIFAADDVLDEWRTKTLISRAREVDADADAASSSSSRRKVKVKVLPYFLTLCYCFKRVYIRHDISHQIKEIGQRIDAIAAQRLQYGLVVSENHNEPRLFTELTSSVIDRSEIRGRENDIKTIVNMLVGESSHHGIVPVHVISIVGMGGFGKTTLAKLVYNEEKVVETFEKRMWVFISQPFDLSRIAKEIIEQVDADVQIPNGWEALHQQLSKSLKGKRFFLILDDVWTDEKAHWEPLKLSLDGGSLGSHVLVTTRNNKVAEMVGSTYTHKLGELSDEESWSLISHVALKGREEDTVKFEKIGKQIAVKCKGNPLAIHILASLLCQERRIQGWRTVVDSDLWELDGVQDKLFPSLFLSFNSLPSISKQCLLYCATFPKDYEIFKDGLVRVWMAQGFFGADGMNKLENIGDYHFGILAVRSFFQDFVEDSHGNIKSCRMHDLVHDFAQFLTRGECYAMEGGVREFDAKKVRHLWALNLESPIYEAKNLRTLIIHNDVTDTIAIQLFDRLPYLRALELNDCRLENLPNELDKLLHLRYLDLSGTLLSELPETICNLYNLQTLYLNRCRQLRKLPERIGQLCNLRHLLIQKTTQLSYLPHEIKRLSSLQTLSKFIVGGPNDMSKIKDLRMLSNLRGSLKISGLQRVRDANEAAQAGLNKKESIRAYKLKFELLRGDDVRKVMEAVLENLEPHEDLEILSIYCYPGYKFPNWMHNSSLLGNIVDMELYKCVNCTELPSLGNLALLEGLKIHGMNSVQQIGNQFYGFGVGVGSSARAMIAFPKLKNLEIRDMENWEEWELPISKYRKIMPCLSKLTLYECQALRVLPCLGKLESLEILSLEFLPSVKCVGLEFYGFGVGSSSSARMMAFPKLKKLMIADMEIWDEWELPTSKYIKIMPCLSELTLNYCPKLSSLPGLGKLESLGVLYLRHLPSVKFVGPEFLGISHVGDDGYSSAQDGVLSFPNLTELYFFYMHNLEQWNIPSFKRNITIIMPRLRNLHIVGCPELREVPHISSFKSLETLYLYTLPKWEGGVEQEGKIVGSKEDHSGRGAQRGDHFKPSSSSSLFCSVEISGCPNLKVVPNAMFPPTLRQLMIDACPGLRGKQPLLPSLLEQLILRGDAGVFSKSLPLNKSSGKHVSYVSLEWSEHSSLPEGFNQLKALQKLYLLDCEFLDFKLEKLQQFIMLQHLEIYKCPLLKERFQGEEWRSILSHVPNITLDDDKIQCK